MSKKMHVTLKEKLNEISIDELNIYTHVILLKMNTAIYRLNESRGGDAQYMWGKLTTCSHGWNGQHSTVKNAIKSVIHDGEVFVIKGSDLAEAIDNI